MTEIARHCHIDTCNSQHSIIRALPFGEVRSDVSTAQPLHLLWPRRARKHAVSAVQQLAQLALGYCGRVVPQVVYNIQHLQ